MSNKEVDQAMKDLERTRRLAMKKEAEEKRAERAQQEWQVKKLHEDVEDFHKRTAVLRRISGRGAIHLVEPENIQWKALNKNVITFLKVENPKQEIRIQTDISPNGIHTLRIGVWNDAVVIREISVRTQKTGFRAYDLDYVLFSDLHVNAERSRIIKAYEEAFAKPEGMRDKLTTAEALLSFARREAVRVSQTDWARKVK